MAARFFAVLDTNVLVSAMFTGNLFYEFALSKEGSFLVTGNTKHFPKEPIVVTPAEMLEIIKNSQE